MSALEWSDLALLLAVARSGSFGAAARRLGVSAPTVGRRLNALEGALGLRLLERRPGGVRLSAEGERIAALADETEERVAALERLALSLREGRSPPVRVSATESVITETLAPALPRLFARDPGLRVELRSAAAVVSLARGEADLAIRMVRPTGNSLIARRLPALQLGLFASRGYLAGRRPDALDLGRERLLGLDDSYGPIPETAWMRETGLDAAVVVRCTSVNALAAAAEAGAGIALLATGMAERRGLIAIALPRPIPPRVPWLVTHPQSQPWPALRKVSAWVVEAFSAGSARGRAARPRTRRA